MKLFKRLAMATALAATFTSALADQYPTRPISLVVPFPAGGITDNIGRVVAAQLSERLGQQIVVENKPGAGGSLAAEQAARAAPDGYTIFLGTVGTHAINLALYKNLSYDPVKDFTAIHSVIGAINLLVAHPSQPFKSVGELIDFASKNPGKLNYASAGNGSGTHLTAELFQSLTGVKLTHVPYRGSAPALTDLVAGTVDLMFDYPSSAGPFIDNGRLRPLAVTHTERLSVYPDVPTIAEAGVPGGESINWGGLFVPAKTPKPIVDKLVSEMEKVMQSPQVAKATAAMGGVKFSYSGEEFGTYVAGEVEKWKDVVRQQNVVLQ